MNATEGIEVYCCTRVYLRKMGLEKHDPVVRSLRAAIADLDFAKCKNILVNESKFADNNFPIFVYICQQKVIWKSACEHVNIDMDSKWSKESLRDHLCHQQNGKHFLDYSTKESCLQKILVDGIFEQFILLFVEFGYNVNATDISGLAAMHYAIKHGLRLTTEILIDSGASLLKEAKIASWIHTKLPALYHCLYTLDIEMLKVILKNSTNCACDIPKLKHIDQFVFLPARLPLPIQDCIRMLDHINPLSFLLIVYAVKSYSNQSSEARMIKAVNEIMNTLQEFFVRNKCWQNLMQEFSFELCEAKLQKMLKP